MLQAEASEGEAIKNETTVERASDRELVVTRMFNAPAHMVFDAWTNPELLKRWWRPSPRRVAFRVRVRPARGRNLPLAFGRDPKEPEDWQQAGVTGRDRYGADRARPSCKG